jgi:hypothetical protein
MQVGDWGKCQGELPYLGHTSRSVQCVDRAGGAVNESLCLQARWVPLGQPK